MLPTYSHGVNAEEKRLLVEIMENCDKWFLLEYVQEIQKYISIPLSNMQIIRVYVCDSKPSASQDDWYGTSFVTRYISI